MEVLAAAAATTVVVVVTVAVAVAAWRGVSARGAAATSVAVVAKVVGRSEPAGGSLSIKKGVD